MRKPDGIVWTMTYTLNNNQIHILDFTPEDNDGYMFFDTLHRLESIEESTGRIAKSVQIDGTIYDVSNPAGIFSYKQPLA